VTARISSFAFSPSYSPLSAVESPRNTHFLPKKLTVGAVWVKRGICSADSFINIALCCLGYLPGLIHAWVSPARIIAHEN
jgi:uncharacterized membrane protein YqaE (UPF0057 family)